MALLPVPREDLKVGDYIKFLKGEYQRVTHIRDYGNGVVDVTAKEKCNGSITCIRDSHLITGCVRIDIPKKE